MATPVYHAYKYRLISAGENRSLNSYVYPLNNNVVPTLFGINASGMALAI